ncbi:kinase-like domain-containing protein [Hygrophoropsis aurantiaca]|uniref:Kinase-like domain-containing protein n=1 Tax=Hygrophoropsis aurantiaca TaxID=72124 RepID=A0ACB7ZSS2_9AGAM|nr:kinase-like domain-containing protein [Hygrophoropsis aurantiaca]
MSREEDVPHFIFTEEPLGLPASEGFGYFQGDPGCSLGPDLRFKLETKLGYGTTSSVWLARDLQNNDCVAIKMLNGCATQLNREDKLQELKVLQRFSFNSPSPLPVETSIHSTRLLTHFYHPGIETDNREHLCLVMKLMGPNIHAIRERLPAYGYLALLTLTTDDITPLGLRPPEIVLGGEWNESVDIWTYGCIEFPEKNAKEEDVLLYQMISFCGEFFSPEFLQRCSRSREYFNTDCKPKKFDRFSRRTFQECISCSKFPFSEEDIERAAAFMHRCLRLDPKDRATAMDLLEDQWLAS